ncbi:DegV family protein [Weissella confusa]|uniref:DegV family protein n=1 Tax=Weissella confusa TaxID=1583 RepID=A0A923NE24_WEICO|nr:DegV family protein [Weissella confusa]
MAEAGATRDEILAELQREEVAAYDIAVVPLTVMIDGVVYHDGVSITPSEFIEKMAEAKALPTTSQPSLGAFTEVYETMPEDVDSAMLVGSIFLRY